MRRRGTACRAPYTDDMPRHRRARPRNFPLLWPCPSGYPEQSSHKGRYRDESDDMAGGYGQPIHYYSVTLVSGANHTRPVPASVILFGKFPSRVNTLKKSVPDVAVQGSSSHYPG